MLIELFELIYSSMKLPDRWETSFATAIVFVIGIVLPITFKHSIKRLQFSLLTISLVFLFDSIISELIIIARALEIDRFPMNVELFLYGIFTFGWLTGTAISTLIRKLAGRN